MPRYYPIFMDLLDKPCVVIGGGAVALRKVRGLLAAGAAVKVVSPDISAGIAALSSKGKVHTVKRRYAKGDLKGAFAAIGASDDASVNAAVYKEALQRRIPVNIVDEPGLCSFIVPAVVRRGDLVIAISTSGRAPGLAKKIRQDIEKFIGPEYGRFLEIIATVRRNLLKNRVNRVKKERVIKELLASSVLNLLKKGEMKKIDALVGKISGHSATQRDTKKSK